MSNLEIRYDENEIWKADLELDNKNKTACTIDNYVLILENDDEIKDHIRFNSFNNNYEYHDGNKEPRIWNDTDDSIYMSYIENRYGIFHEKKYYKALMIAMKDNSYNPLKELIENEEWDGKKRIDRFLTDILKCEDTDYARELSRMLFFGGIARLYKPGIKFDYMLVFCGEQGLGKSTIINWLALHSNYYKEVTTIEKKEGVECVRGGWICEFSELLAMRGEQNKESMKAFISRTVDSYRPAYAVRTESIPRTCIFIGTTNNATFLTDNTGNRRYLPIDIKIPRGELFEKEKEIKEYIICCWREALYLMRNGSKEEFYLTIPSQYWSVLQSEQESRMIEDPKLEDLKEYLMDKQLGYKICSKEIHAKIFNGLDKNMTSREAHIIGDYMNKFKNWTRVNNPTTIENYGRQKYWVKEYNVEYENKEENEND